ncbi:DedA family protein [uncultured Mucilaginibacter sp.]|uniref:DedA family protein n=1 Tax=uncultured Mucilaginibacter sp. TaxID=797541 RepID=UPI0025F68D0C|nr:DedA family protein [uncultured Mucilaginibacter sp.]
MELIKTIIDFILHIDKNLALIINEYQGYTYLILFAIIFAETGFVVTPFLPGDSLLFAAGALIAVGNTGLNIFILGLILIAAAFTGNTVNYELGKFFGIKIFKPENKVLKLEYYNQTHAFFEKHGGNAVILSRFVPIIRTIAPFVAGVSRMPFLRYTLYNIIGGASWIILLLSAGYFLGTIPFFKTHFSLVTLAIIFVSILPPIYAAVKGKMTKQGA